MSAYMDSAVRVRAPLVTDKYGNTTTERDWTKAVRTPITGVSVQPDGSSETDGDRELVITGWKLYTPRGRDLDLVKTDRVEWDGMTLEVDGEVARWRLGGRVHHVEIRLKRVTG
ncbi:head-to-tail connector complex protein [Streptomyces phage Nesbitt]|uniref:Head-to-tail connector complex protein n=1 Tax=Streptomyces phage Nesbitt TaxID=2108133 RepID=A0A2P1JSY3_9CAUD|nr:head-to-tail connector complex protein [Streptomyces phage Nesbitt]